jgi:hypothetical protein
MDTFSVGKFMKLPLITLALCLTAGLTAAQVGGGKSTGQSLYLPIYSHIWHGDTNSHGKLAKTLVSVSISIRNTDQRQTVRIVSATYFDTDGKKLREYLQAPKIIGPMGTYELFVPRSDDTGGSGANSVISWKSDNPVNPPLVQALHANMPAGRSIAFTTSAVAIPSD